MPRGDAFGPERSTFGSHVLRMAVEKREVHTGLVVVVSGVLMLPVEATPHPANAAVSTVLFFEHYHLGGIRNPGGVGRCCMQRATTVEIIVVASQPPAGVIPLPFLVDVKVEVIATRVGRRTVQEFRFYVRPHWVPPIACRAGVTIMTPVAEHKEPVVIRAVHQKPQGSLLGVAQTTGLMGLGPGFGETSNSIKVKPVRLLIIIVIPSCVVYMPCVVCVEVTR